jgi:hypothetical protein
MNEGDESFLSTETRKRRRRFRFRYSSKKVLERSREAKCRRSGLTSVTKVLSYISALSSEFGTAKHHDCAIESGRTPLLESVDKLEGEGKDMSLAELIYEGDSVQRVSNITLIYLCQFGIAIAKSFVLLAYH